MLNMGPSPLNDDDTVPLSGFSDACSLDNMNKVEPIGKKDNPSGPFELISEADIKLFSIQEKG
jgi:hypothetical protein